MLFGQNIWKLLKKIIESIYIAIFAEDQSPQCTRLKSSCKLNFYPIPEK